MAAAQTAAVVSAATVADHLNQVSLAVQRLSPQAVAQVVEILRAARERGATVFVAGNGGSAATASHFVCDLQKAAHVRALALTDNVPLITAWANDVHFDDAFARQLAQLAREGDVLVVISCSGTSPSVVEAINASVDFEMPVVLLAGKTAPFWSASHAEVRVDHTDYGVIEDVHLAVCHAVAKALRGAPGCQPIGDGAAAEHQPDAGGTCTVCGECAL